MKLYHVTRKSNLENIKKNGLSLDFFLKESKYSGNHSGEAIYLSKFIEGNNLTFELELLKGKNSLLSLEIELSKLEDNFIYTDDGIYWAFENEVIFNEDDLEELQSAFNIKTINKAKKKLKYLENLSHEDLVKEFKKIWKWYLIEEGEISYKKNIPFEDISNIIEI